MNQFRIQVEDGSEILPTFVMEQNSSSLELYDWQNRAIDFFFKHNGKAIFEVTTGVGKTVCAIQLMKVLLKENKDLKTLIVVPKNVILEKTWYKELYDFGFSITEIGIYYGGGKEYSNITLTNMQSLSKVDIDRFDFVIYDEIHNYGTARMLEFVKHPFKYSFGLSATVERTDNAHNKISEIFNHNIFKYSPKQALREGILNSFSFVNIGIDMDDDTYERYEKITADLNLIFKIGGGWNRIIRSNKPIKYRMLKKFTERKDLVNNYSRKFDVLKQICNKHRKDKILVFNEFNKQTSKCYWYLLDEGIKARIMHSGIEKEKREQDLIDYKNDKFNVLLTTRVLDEGYNLPKIDTAIIMAGQSSARQTIQRLGRVLRKKDKDSSLYQLYCNGTIEAEQGYERTKIFKELCSKYDEYRYDGENEVFI